VNPVAITALLLTSFYTAANKEYLMRRQIIFKHWIYNFCSCIVWNFHSNRL